MLDICLVTVDCALLNPVRARGLLFEGLFKLVDCGGQHDFTELAVLSVRKEIGGEPTLDGQKAVSTIQY